MTAAPCCAACAKKPAGALPITDDASSSTPTSAGAANVGAILTFALVFLGVLYGEKLLTRLGG